MSLSAVQLCELRMEFASKKSVYGMLVGSIYPGILYNEMEAIQEKYIQAGGSWKDVTLPRHPGPGGYAR